MNRLLEINAPSVVSEIIDGEVIIMNLKSGNYYSSDKVGAVVWTWIEEGKTEREIHGLAASRYRADAQDISDALGSFYGQLVEEGLVREVEAPPAGVVAAGAGNGAGEDMFFAPELHAYKDMQDLLLLDPIHDVDTVGWPKARDA
jgi:Coenzyme PQQ synthesis protein D (PqqD)